MKICKKLMLSALCVSLLPGSFLFAQTRETPSQPQGFEIPTGGTVIQQRDLATPQVPATQPAPVQGQVAPVQGVVAPQGQMAQLSGPVFYEAITPESQAIFDKAMGQQVGTVYKPMCVETIEHGGQHYRFFCIASTTTNPPQTKNAFVTCFIGLDGKMSGDMKNITDIERKNLMGGWTEFKPLDDKAKEIYAKTSTDHSQAPPCVPLCVSTQVVSGMNYRFICLCDNTTDPAKKGNAIRTVYVDLRGNVKVTDFTTYDSGDLQKLLKGEDPKTPQPNTVIPATSQPTATPAITSQAVTSQPSGPMLGQPRQQTQPQRVIVPRSR